MSYIYDGFPSSVDAEQFAYYVRRRTALVALVYASQAESDRIDPFPWALNPPIVLVQRESGDEFECLLERRATFHGGRYVGT